MSEQAGQWGDALAARLTAFTRRHDELADADRQLAAVLASAYAVALDALSRLDHIEHEIESAVAAQHTLALDTAIGAHHWQRFLLAIQHEIVAVVTEAGEHAAAKIPALQGLMAAYQDSGATSVG